MLRAFFLKVVTSLQMPRVGQPHPLTKPDPSLFCPYGSVGIQDAEVERYGPAYMEGCSGSNQLGWWPLFLFCLSTTNPSYSMAPGSTTCFPAPATVFPRIGPGYPYSQVPLVRLALSLVLILSI